MYALQTRTKDQAWHTIGTAIDTDGLADLVIVRDEIRTRINRVRNKVALANKRTRGERGTIPKRYPVAVRVIDTDTHTIIDLIDQA